MFAVCLALSKCSNPFSLVFINSDQTPVPDLFEGPIHSVSASSSSSSSIQAADSTPRPSVLETLKELRMMTRHLCQLVKTTGYLLTVAHSSATSESVGSQSELYRLQGADPLPDHDYQVRDTTLLVSDTICRFAIPLPSACSTCTHGHFTLRCNVWRLRLPPCSESHDASPTRHFWLY